VKRPVEILKSGEGPQETVPLAAEMIFKKMDSKDITLVVKVSALSFLVSDLVELGNAAGAFNASEKEVPMILQNSIQRYFEYGVKAGTIDPIELQKESATMMTPEQKQRGMGLAQEGGVPMEATGQQAIVKSQQDAMAPLQAENEKLKGMLAQAQAMSQQQAQVPTQPQTQGGV